MKQSINIGTQGNQPFKIKNPFVSARHARVDIDDNGRWTLTDLQSTNGTFVRDDETGNMVRVSNIDITPLTFLCLGPNVSKGCSFYARQLKSPGNYDAEFALMNQKEDEYDNRIKYYDALNKRINLLSIILPFIVFVTLMLVWGMSDIPRIVLLTLLPSLLKMFFNSSKTKAKLAQQHDNFRICPNPAYSHKMRPDEIRSYDCLRCHC